MSTTPHPDDGEPTVAMPARATATTPVTETRPLPVPSRPGRRRVPSVAAVVTIVLFAAAAAGSFIVVQRMKPGAAPSPRVPDAAAPQATEATGSPAAPPARPPETPAGAASRPPAPRPLDARQMLNEIFDGRDRARSVSASVDGDAVRINSSRPGYVYVLAASVSQSDEAALFVAVLFPRTADTKNRVAPGRALKLPEFQWPPNAELLAIVSDEPREIDVLGPLAGKVVCAAGAPCSQAYGAVVVSRDGPRDTLRLPAPPKAPASRPTHAIPRRCSDILERASLGEPLTDEEQTFLKRDCR